MSINYVTDTSHSRTKVFAQLVREVKELRYDVRCALYSSKVAIAKYSISWEVTKPVIGNYF